VLVEGYTPKSSEDALASFNSVSDRYFETVGTPMVAGRDFKRYDTASSTKVAIISKSLARKFFGVKNPIGQHFRIREGGVAGGLVEIVGIVNDAKYSSLRDEISPFVFLPWSQGGVPGPLTSFALRAASGVPGELVPAVKSALSAVNPDISINFQTLAAKVNDSIAREKLLATLSGVFGALALLLASIGLYGVMSHNVARRRNEIGIRMALGAHPSRVLRMVLGEAAVLIGIGAAVVLAAAIGTTRFVASFLYGMNANDPWTLTVAAAVLILVAAVSGFLPARRAARLDPMDALREE
jgi:predicted permease